MAIVACALVGTTVPAVAAPRVALLAPTLSPPERELARAALEATGVEARVMRADELPLLGPCAALRTARAAAGAAAARARAAFVQTHFAEARALVGTAEAAARPWAADAQVAHTLVELALIATQSGDDAAIDRAAAYGPALTLEAARWNPELRRRFVAAQERQRAAPRMLIEVTSEPVNADVVVDGVAAGNTPTRLSLTAGPHAFALERAGFASLFETVVVDGSPLRRRLARLSDVERLAQVRCDVDDDRLPDLEALSLAAGTLECDAAIAVSAEANRARMAGPRLAGESFERSGPRSNTIGELSRMAGQTIQAACALRHTAPERGRAGTPLTLEVDAAPCVARMHAAFHVAAGSWQTRAAALSNGHGALTLTASELPSSTRPYNLEYRLWGESDRGSAVGALGSETAPLRVLIEADRAPTRSRRWYQKWWVWTIAGSVLTAGAVGIGLAVYRPPSQARLVGF